MYFVVEFDDGVEVVPKNWVQEGEKFSYCPKEEGKFYRLVENRTDPKPHWILHPIRRILGGAGKFFFFPKVKV